MTRKPDVQVVLLGRQPFRCRWQRIERRSGEERHLVVARDMLDRIDTADVLQGFAMVHPVDEVTTASAGAVVERLAAEGRETTAVATNDEYLLGACAGLQQRHGLVGPSPSEVAVFTDKLAMKRAVNDAGIRMPAGLALSPRAAATDPEALASRIVTECGLPVVLKPRSSANSLDVSVVRTRSELVARCRTLRRDDLMAEEFVAGRVLFCDSLQSGAGCHTTLMTAVYAHPPLGYRGGSCHGSRTLPDGPLAERVQAFTRRVLDAMPTMADRVTHLEVLERDGELWFLEVAARAPGAEVARCGELHRGINLEELNFRLQLGLPWHIASPPNGQVAWMWYPKRDGTVMARTAPDLDSPVDLTWQVDVGDRVRGAEHSPNNRREDAALIVVAGPSDANTLEADFARLIDLEPVVYRDASGDPGGRDGRVESRERA